MEQIKCLGNQLLVKFAFEIRLAWRQFRCLLYSSWHELVLALSSLISSTTRVPSPVSHVSQWNRNNINNLGTLTARCTTAGRIEGKSPVQANPIAQPKLALSSAKARVSCCPSLRKSSPNSTRLLMATFTPICRKKLPLDPAGEGRIPRNPRLRSALK